MSVTRIAGRYLLGRGHIEVKEVAFKGKSWLYCVFHENLYIRHKTKNRSREQNLFIFQCNRGLGLYQKLKTIKLRSLTSLLRRQAIQLHGAMLIKQ